MKTELIPLGDGFAPRAPANISETGVEAAILKDQALKLASTAYSFSAEWAARRLHLPVKLVEDLLQQLAKDAMLEILGEADLFTHRYAIVKRGLEEATRLLEVSGYIGPAPVSLESYTEFLEWQIGRFPAIRPRDVVDAISEMVLPEEAVRLAGLTISSGRSLFLYGPPGNGKTTLGRLLHTTFRGDLWIPYCIGIDSSIVRVFDPLSHQPVPVAAEEARGVDGRWVRIQRPLIVAGGELTIDALDLAYSSSLRYYEAPLHVKANGGTFLIDDFGRQRVDPHALLNRWIAPLEYGVDHLTLRTGQQIQVPFRQMLIVATNMDLGEVTDSAFLRRIGYRLFLDNPTPERYAEIFNRYAAGRGVTVPEGLISHIFDRYNDEGVELRACHPRDLIDRALDIRRFNDKDPELLTEDVDLAWAGYFGEARP